MIASALYLMTTRKRPSAVTDDVEKFTSWYGFKDETGKIAIGQHWMRESMLFSAYKSIMDSPETEARIKQAVVRPSDYKIVRDIYNSTPFPSSIWKVTWSAPIRCVSRRSRRTYWPTRLTCSECASPRGI
jgi:hypothetical protein